MLYLVVVKGRREALRSVGIMEAPSEEVALANAAVALKIPKDRMSATYAQAAPVGSMIRDVSEDSDDWKEIR